MFRPADCILTALNVGIRPSNLSAQFGDFQNGQRLLLFHLVADINIDTPDITGNLGVDIDVLIGPESA